MRTLSAAVYPLQTLYPPPLSSPCPSEAIRLHHALPHLMVSCTQSPNLVHSRCGLQLPLPRLHRNLPSIVIIAFSAVTHGLMNFPSSSPHVESTLQRDYHSITNYLSKRAPFPP